MVTNIFNCKVVQYIGNFIEVELTDVNVKGRKIEANYLTNNSLDKPQFKPGDAGMLLVYTASQNRNDIGNISIFLGNIKTEDRPTPTAANQTLIADYDIATEEFVYSFNNGDNGGIPKVEVIKNYFEATNNILQAVLSIINGPPIPTAAPAAPDALQVALNAALIGKSVGTYTDIEDEKVKH